MDSQCDNIFVLQYKTPEDAQGYFDNTPKASMPWVQAFLLSQDQVFLCGHNLKCYQLPFT